MVLTGEIRVVDLDIAEAIIVENLKLHLVRFGDVGEVLLIAWIYVLWVCSSLLVTHVIPFRCRERHLALVHSLLGNNALQVIPLIDVGASNVLDLTRADDGLAGLVARLGESGNVGHIHAEYVDVGVLDLFEALHAWEEGAPEHYGLLFSV